MLASAVILAAGASRRMGKPKALVRWEGRTLLEWAVHNAAVHCSECVVVAGHAGIEVCDAVSQLAARGYPVQAVKNPVPTRGMLSSILVGAEAVGTDWFFVSPVDMPCLDPAVYLALLQEAEWSYGVGGETYPRSCCETTAETRQQRDLAGEGPVTPGKSPPYKGLDGFLQHDSRYTPTYSFYPLWQDHRGHPVLVARQALEGVAFPSEQAPREGGAMRRLLEQYPARGVAVNHRGILLDLDTPEDLNRADCSDRGEL